ncbi:MAG: OB-fold nucleic acid binding domain-containing protein [Candidatus Thorarchaeota archaeon]
MKELKIRDIEPGRNFEILARILSVSPARIITTRDGRKTQLTEVLIADESGTAVLSLWGFGVGSELKAGQVIRITDGWAKEWQGKIQLSLGRAGRLEPVGDDGSLPMIADLRKDLSGSESVEES